MEFSIAWTFLLYTAVTMNRFFALTVISCLLLTGSSFLQAQSSGTSESGKIAWRIVEGGGGGQVMISEGDQGEAAGTKLFETVSANNTKVFVSPDDHWIIVESGTGSLGFYLTVFKREKGTIYRQRKDVDIGEPVINAAFKSAGREGEARKLDHTYMRLLAWSADSESVLVQVRARGGKLQFGPYVVAYDLGKKAWSNDLSKFNAKAIRP